MTEHESVPQDGTAPAPAAPLSWETPEYVVVDTALEVTAYRLADR
ncbi:pyrroloquinoline quinone precursor peptide PqqA [Actinomycetota bacterium Odt1-20B]